MTHRTLLGLGVATLLLAAPTACSDDDSSDLCATMDSLNASIVDVSEVDVDQDTLTELEDEVGDVRTDLEEVRSEASDEYSDEIDAVSEASTNLSISLDTARATPSSSTIADVVTTSQSLATAVRNLGDALKDTC